MSPRALKRAARAILSVAASGVFLWLSLRSTDVRAVARVISSADPLPFLVYLGVQLAVHAVRTARWGALLDPTLRLGWRRLNAVNAVASMLLMILPLRLGELSRPLLVAREPAAQRDRLSPSAVLASSVVERVVDGIAFGVLGVFALRALGASASDTTAELARRGAAIMAAGFLAICLALAAAYALRERAIAILRRALGVVSTRLAAWACAALSAFLEALRVGSGARALYVLALTVVQVALCALGIAVLAPAFGFRLSPLMASAVVVAQIVGMMVPAGAGMVGTYQFFTQAGLAIVVPGALSDPAVAARAAGFANALWALQFVQIVGLGAWFVALGRVSIEGVLRAPARASP